MSRALRIHRFLSSCILGLAAIVASGPLPAYETLGATWPGGRIPFRINPNFADLERAGSPEQQIDLLLCAVGAWRDQSRADMFFEYQGTTTIRRLSERDGVNVVFWSSAGDSEALAATLFSGEGGVAKSFDIVFFAETTGVPNLWSGPGDPVAGELDIQGVAVHELGHALGLGHTTVFNSTMYPSVAGTAVALRTLEEDDRVGVEFLYGIRDPDPPAVEISSIDPTRGPAEGGNEVRIGGINFTHTTDTRLYVGDFLTARTDYVVESCGDLRIARMPPGPPGLVPVRIVNKVGSVTLPDAYLYEGTSVLFVRGDANRDSKVDVSDPISLLGYLFQAEPGPLCADAADCNDDGTIDISDAVSALLFLFGSQDALPPPSSEPGEDPTADSLGCGE